MLSNLIRVDPETAKAQREEKAVAQKARQKEIERLRGQYNQFTNEKFIATVLPEDVEYGKKFLKGRIEKLQTSTTMTEDQLAAFKESKEGLQFDNFYKALRRRFTFKTEFEGYKKDYTGRGEALKKEGKAVPKEFNIALKLSDEALKWFKGAQNETIDVYDDKQREIIESYKEQTAGQNVDNPDKTEADVSAAFEAARSEFSISGLIADTMKWVAGYFTTFMLILAVLVGASLATNLNIYRNWAYRLLYAVYGGAFFFLVIPYVLLYRWAWMGKRPRFYSILPLVPYHWDGSIGQLFLSWLSFRPDTIVYDLEEWKDLQNV